jgi:hypothetical protein
LAELTEAAEASLLPVRTNAYLLVKTFEGESLGEWFNAYRPGQTFGTSLRIAGLKVFTDFDNGTVLFWEPAELEAFLRERREEGWQLTLKSVSTLSLELVLDAVEPILQEGSNSGPRFRIEHALAVNDEQLARMARMGLIASIQPGIVGVIAGQPDLNEVVGREGAEVVARWRDLAEPVLRSAVPITPTVPTLNTRRRRMSLRLAWPTAAPPRSVWVAGHPSRGWFNTPSPSIRSSRC